MQDVIIVCAGSVAFEVYNIIQHINHHEIEKGNKAKYNILGFLNDDPDALVSYPYIKQPILGNINNWKSIGDEKYILATSVPKTKEKISKILKDSGCVFETIISPYTIIDGSVEIGEGCFITAYAITTGVKIGNFCTIMGSMVGGTAVVGDYSTTLGFANIANGKLGKRVYVGSQAVVLDVEVGDDAFISVGSIVVSKVKAGTKVFGNPAKRIDF